jgi:TetR/AcrR family transcriptional repressor of bet genes
MAIKAWNRQKIIDATIDVIARHGIAETTVARIVERAQVSMGLVNQQFTSKASLFDEVLKQLSEHYRHQWKKALSESPADTAEKIIAIIRVDLDPAVLNVSTMGVWFSFRAHVRRRPEYGELVGIWDSELTEQMVYLFNKLNAQCGKDYPVESVVRGLVAMQEGLWTEFLLNPNSFDRERAFSTIVLFLGALYPGQFQEHLPNVKDTS